MDQSNAQFDVRRIRRGDPDHLVALHVALGEEPTSGATIAPRVIDLLDMADRDNFTIDLVCGAYRNGRLASACVAAESPGRAALVLTPLEAGLGTDYDATAAVLRYMQGAAWRDSLKLLEVLVSPGSVRSSNCLSNGGFRPLTRLLYLRREADVQVYGSTSGGDLEWVMFDADRWGLFCEGLEATYVQSLDCPELTGLRDTSEVLEGHRATGVFHPDLWWLVLRDRLPVGVLLLNELPSVSALEIVYVGVAQVARGTGVADALLERAVTLTKSKSVTCLTLAVDVRNEPARRMYDRWGFRGVLEREAWIASSPTA